jgi:hypothetical protein
VGPVAGLNVMTKRKNFLPHPCREPNPSLPTRTSRARHEACEREKIHVYRILIGKSKARDHLEDLGVDGRIILKQTLKLTVSKYVKVKGKFVPVL